MGTMLGMGIFVHNIYEGGKRNCHLLIIRIKYRSFPSLCTSETHRTVF